MFIRAAFVICLVTVSCTIGFACINGDVRMLKSGFWLYEEEWTNVPRGHDFSTGDGGYAEAIDELDSLFKTTNDFDYLSDKGVLLIIDGQYEKAIELYLDIERAQPNRYTTASNVGTAYELAGQNEKALHWIKRAVEIDSTSHHNSEWIHVKILEAKIKGEEYFTTSFLLNKDFGDKSLPQSSMTKAELDTLAKGLFFQLHERMSFVEPKEKIVAQLLFDLGNVMLLQGEYKDALEVYHKAELYGFEGELIEMRITAAKDASDQGLMSFSENAPGGWSLAIILIAAAGLIVGGAAYKKWREDRE
jgi:hypothetical protein